MFKSFYSKDQAVDYIMTTDRRYTAKQRRKAQQDIDKSGITKILGDIIIVDMYDLLA